jgi:hypothetical protein
MRPIRWTALVFASILTSAALEPTLSARYEEGKPSPPSPERQPSASIPE